MRARAVQHQGAPARSEVARRLGLEREVVDTGVRETAIRRLRDLDVVLPTFAQLRDPALMPAGYRERLVGVDPDAPHAANLLRVHWRNGQGGAGPLDVPEHVVLGPAVTGVEAPIAVLLGDRFPMIKAHKVLAAYACLVPRLVTGQFDPTRHRAVWPSTGNYARGGVAISRIMGCRGVAVLPQGMSRERFEWLERWVADPADIVRTPGSESNVKEIYDECARLEADPDNFVLNQFCEFGNHLVHYEVTGTACERVAEHLIATTPATRVAAFVSASGSAGTIGAGDRLKESHGARIVGVEALECPTMLENGFGEHNIQGIGDKHIPLIHNIMNMDLVTAISDRATDDLDVFLQSATGRALLAARGASADVLGHLGDFGPSGICNVLAAARTARYLGLGPEDLVVTVATDAASLYGSERAQTLARRFPGGFDNGAAREVFGRHILGLATDHLIECTEPERRRIFNLGYFTWVEQQGTPFDLFVARRDQKFWRDLRPLVADWDALIDDVNARTGLRS